MMTAERVSLAVLACMALLVGCLIAADSCSEVQSGLPIVAPGSDSVAVDTSLAAPPARNAKKRSTRHKKEKRKVVPRSRDYLNEPAR